jgi:hypothetical protein
MTFDLGVWHADRALDDATADEVYLAICEGAELPNDGSLSASPRVAAFMAALGARYPDLDSLPDGAVDDSPWSSGFEYTAAHSIFNIRWSRAEAMLAEMRALAAEHELVVYDPQESRVYNPPQLVPRRRWQFWRR